MHAGLAYHSKHSITDPLETDWQADHTAYSTEDIIAIRSVTIVTHSNNEEPYVSLHNGQIQEPEHDAYDLSNNGHPAHHYDPLRTCLRHLNGIIHFSDSRVSAQVRIQHSSGYEDEKS